MTTIAVATTTDCLLLDALRKVGPAVAATARIGVDAVDVDGLGRNIAAAGERLVARLFSPDERAFCSGDDDRFATTLAGKEAVAKALGTGVRGGVTWQHIEILREPAGEPYVRLTGSRPRPSEGTRSPQHRNQPLPRGAARLGGGACSTYRRRSR